MPAHSTSTHPTSNMSVSKISYVFCLSYNSQRDKKSRQPGVHVSGIFCIQLVIFILPWSLGLRHVVICYTRITNWLNMRVRPRQCGHRNSLKNNQIKAIPFLRTLETFFEIRPAIEIVMHVKVKGPINTVIALRTNQIVDVETKLN